MKRYRIRNKNNHSLYWSNSWGWGNLKGSDSFSEEAKNAFNLPLEGKWVTDKSQILPKMKDHSDYCGSYPCDGGNDCWINCQPTEKQCKKCLCSSCVLGTCTGGKPTRELLRKMDNFKLPEGA